MAEEKTPAMPVICLAGPTGAGKTALALTLCEELGGEVVNADSRQVYRDFPIITAQPSPEEQSRAPHHLYGYLGTRERTDTADWAARAVAEIRAIRERGHVPLLVGGTGFYFQTILHGIANIPPVPEEVHNRILARMEREGAPALHRELEKTDPDYAAKIHPNDRQRTARALEVSEATGHTFTWWHRNAAGSAPCRGPLLVVNTPLAKLEPGLAARIDIMLRNGALDEGRRAMRECCDTGAPGWTGIGCREVLAYLTGRIDEETMKSLWFHNTRAYAKRQITWFRGRKETVWISPSDPEDVLARCRAFLSGTAG